MHVYRLSSALALTALVAAAACSDNTSPALTAFYANMTGDQVVPAVTSTATGQATINNFSGSAPPAVKVTYTGLTPTHITINTGQGTANGAALADVCGGTAAACGASGATYNAVMIGTNTAQALYNTMKGTNGGTYILVITAAHATGEIRGSIVYTPATTS